MVDPFSLIPGMANASTGLASLLYTVKRNRRADEAASDAGSREALAAHMAVQQAAVSVLYRLRYIASTGLPPSWTGMLWTWPASFRATRDLPAALESLQLAYAAAATTGPADLLDEATHVIEAVDESLKRFATKGQERAACQAQLDEAYGAVGAYIAMLRARWAGDDEGDDEGD